MLKKETTLRWGIVGCGSVAETKGGPALYKAPGSQLVAVMSRDEEKARSFARRHGVKQHYSRIDDLLNHQEVNAVYIATPVASHCWLTLAAAAAGKHVFCEKPMAMNVEECHRMIEACRKNKVTLMIAYYRRFFPNIIKARELLEGEAIGRAILAKVMTSSPSNPAKNASQNWRIDPRLSGGGVLMDIGSHRLDLLLYLFGDAVRIEGITDSAALPSPVDDSVTFAMQFRSGVQAMGFITWALSAKYDSIEIVGSRGTITINEINSGRLKLQNDKGTNDFQLPVLEYTHIGLVSDFVRHIESGSAISCSGEVGLKTNALMARIYEQNRV